MVKQATGKGFETFDHTADVGIIVYGTEIKQVFSNATLALFSLNRGNRNFEEEYLYDIGGKASQL